MRCVGVLGACTNLRTRKMFASPEACGGDRAAPSFGAQRVAVMAWAMGLWRTSSFGAPIAGMPRREGVVCTVDGLTSRCHQAGSFPPIPGAPWE